MKSICEIDALCAGAVKPPRTTRWKVIHVPTRIIFSAFAGVVSPGKQRFEIHGIPDDAVLIRWFPMEHRDAWGLVIESSEFPERVGICCRIEEHPIEIREYMPGKDLPCQCGGEKGGLPHSS